MHKGKQLEEATAPLVAAILAGSDLGLRQFKIESNKIVQPHGVPHEIDIFVTEEPGGQIYLFECKNEQRAVGKEAVVLLKANMNLVGAARGFIVAPSFSKHAVTQAKLDGIELLDAKQHEISPIQLQAFDGHAKTFTVRNISGSQGLSPVTFATTVRYNGEEMPFQTVVERLAKGLVALRIAQPDALASPPGTHDLVGAGQVTLADGVLTAGGASIHSFLLICPIAFTMTNPPIRYGYDIASGHIIARFEKFRVGENQWADTVTVAGPYPAPPT